MAALNGTENEKAFISEELYEKLSAVSGKLEKGDILVTGGGSVGKPYIVPNNEPLYTKDADLLWVKNNEKLVPYFIYTFFFSPAFSDYLNSVSHVGTIAHYTITQLEETPITLPCVSEQQKIGDYFRNIDSLITLHQRKYDKLTKVKKAMLEKMFPENGSPYPEIRFKGFTDAWEQRKLGDIASDMVAGGDIDKDLILAEGQYPVIANALTGDGIVGYYDKEYRVNAPAVTVTGRGDVGHAKARLVNFTPVVRLLSVKSEHDVFFLENVINTLKIVIESTGVPQLTVPQLAKYEVAFPRQLDEEEHIGAFFKQLDHLITLHQRM